MNEKTECYKFFTYNKNIFSIFIGILFLTLINIICKCYACKNPESLYIDDDIYDDYKQVLVNI